MAQHRRQTNTAARNIAAATIVVAGSVALAPAPANAAEVRVPNTPISAELPGIENIPGLASIPGIDQWVPELSGQGGGSDIRAAINAVKAVPGVANIPGFNAFLDSVEGSLPAEVAPAATVEPAAQYAAEQTVAAPVASSGQQIVDIARTKIGSPYVYGAAGPNAFDCSGFTSWVHAQAGKNIPRTSQAQAGAGQPVSLGALQPGDIIAYYGGASHVGIYTGHGTIIDALNEGEPVAERPMDWMPIHSAFRF